MSQTSRGSVGKLGEDLAVGYFTGQGRWVIGRSYRKRWSEIDIIAESSKGLHFIEVKSVRADFYQGAMYRPEENAHSVKLRRLAKVIETYLWEKGIGADSPWQLDVIAVEIDFSRKTSKIRYIESVSIA